MQDAHRLKALSTKGQKDPWKGRTIEKQDSRHGLHKIKDLFHLPTHLVTKNSHLTHIFSNMTSNRYKIIGFPILEFRYWKTNSLHFVGNETAFFNKCIRFFKYKFSGDFSSFPRWMRYRGWCKRYLYRTCWGCLCICMMDYLNLMGNSWVLMLSTFTLVY